MPGMQRYEQKAMQKTLLGVTNGFGLYYKLAKNDKLMLYNTSDSSRWPDKRYTTAIRIATPFST